MPSLCPGCKHADPLAKTEWGLTDTRAGMAVTVTVPVNLCGRCGAKVARDALNAAALSLAALRKGAK